MFEKTIEKVMNHLIQVDIDAYHAYEDAIKAINESDIQKQLTVFQKDHQRHIEELSDLLKKLGGKPIERTRDLKGFLIEGMTMVQSLRGTTGILKAMVTNEKITRKQYSDALEYEGFTKEVKQLIEQNFQDEKRHLAWVEKKLAERDTED